MNSSKVHDCRRSPMKSTKTASDSKRSQSTRGSQKEEETDEGSLVKMKALLESIHNKVRLVKLRQYDTNSKLGFSLRGGKESTGSSVGVFVSHVEQRSEADKKGLKIGDQLMQVNGLNVNQATYDEVIGLIKQTPRSHDILLRVTNFGKIPVQEKPGDSISWLPVLELLEAEPVKGSNRQHKSTKNVAQVEPEVTERPKLMEPNPKAFSLSSDEGIESCESQRAHSLSSESDEADTCSPAKTYLPARQQLAAQDAGSHDDSALSSTLTLSNDDECCSCSSVCSISSASASVASSEQVASSNLSAEDKHIRVPGGQRSSEPFGCGVVKGPNEWPGIFVQNVRSGSLAERVGLQPGDQLLEADGQVLAELTFDVAIGLIKRLQQQQEELLLLVRKGAALKHLASNRLQQNQQAAAAAAVQQQHRLKSTQPTSSERRRKEAIAVPGSRSLQNQQVVKSETAESTTTATAITTTTTTTSTAALTSTNCSLEASRVSSSGDLISDTQNHSSAKLTSPQQQQQQQRKVACDVNMEMRKWSSKLKSAQEQQVVASQVDRGRRLSEQRQHLKAPVADRQEQQAQEEEQRQCSSPSPQHQRQQPQQRTTASSQWQFRRQQVAERPEETSSAPVEQQPPTGALKNQRAEAVAATKIAVPRGCNDNKVNCQANKMRYREEADEEDEEIRIVSQNCKLYHHQSGVAHHSFKSSSILHEKFPHLASSRHHQQVQVPQQQRAGQTPAQRKMQPPAPSARRRQTVDDMRRQLDSRTRQPATGQLQRYVSMDNLWIGQRQQQQAHQQVVRPQPRGVSACRFEPASDHGYSRPEVPSSAVMSSRQQRLYRRSNSVMGQSALAACCLPAGSGSGELNMECGQRTCCLQQVRQPPRCMSAARKYNNTIGAPLALSRAKARSMDKLNMNISLNYVNIGMNHYQALARNHLPQVNAPSDCASGGSPKQLRPIGGHHHHLPVCCMSAAANPTLPNIYNYATAARMISSGTQSSPRLTSHQRLPGTASSTATTCCEQAVRERRQVTCQLVASPAKRAVSQTRAATTCCEPPPSTATIYAQSMIPHKSPRDQCSAKTAYTLSGSRVAAPSYTCCSLICCPQSAAESLVCAHNNLQVAGTKPREHLVSRSRKYDVNHVTDSSTDSSRYTISSVVGSRHRQPRLLKVCKAPQPPPPPPPPPVEAGNKCRAPCLIGQRDTRQHLTTFLATPSLGRQVNSSDVSPTCSSYSVTSSSPSSTSSASSSSASSTSTGSTTSANDLSMSDGRSVSPPTTCRPVLVGRQQKRAPAPAAPEAQHHIPRPPPPPGQDLDFERKMGKLVEQANNVQLASGVVGQSKPEVSKANRLCFVDELKMLAKRQQQQQQQQKQQQSGQVTKTGHPTQVTSALDSSTLIKIINASKPSAGCKSCSCQSGVGQRQSNATEPDTCAAAKCSRSGNRSSESKSVKLSDEDNKRRQHEMLMKEFKSAHSRMFKQRAAKLEEEISGSRDNNNNHHQQVNCDVVEKPAKRTGIKSLAVTSANGGLLPIHAVI